VSLARFGQAVCLAVAVSLAAAFPATAGTVRVSFDWNLHENYFASGQVVSSPAGVACSVKNWLGGVETSGTCEATFSPGTAVTLSAIPGPESSFWYWISIPYGQFCPRWGRTHDPDPRWIPGPPCGLPTWRFMSNTATLSFAAVFRPNLYFARMSLSYRWRESAVIGSIQLNGYVLLSSGLPIDASVRVNTKRAMPIRIPAAGPARISPRITLPHDLVPGPVDVAVNPLGCQTPCGKPNATFSDRLRAPPEGVAPWVYISATQGGRPLRAIQRTNQLWAHFRFAAAPTLRPVLAHWIDPSGKRFEPVQRRGLRRVASRIGSPNGLGKGNWTCVLTAGRKVVKRVSVRVG
jgi:hypothetical protein